MSSTQSKRPGARVRASGCSVCGSASAPAPQLLPCVPDARGADARHSEELDVVPWRVKGSVGSRRFSEAREAFFALPAGKGTQRAAASAATVAGGCSCAEHDPGKEPEGGSPAPLSPKTKVWRVSTSHVWRSGFCARLGAAGHSARGCGGGGRGRTQHQDNVRKRRPARSSSGDEPLLSASPLSKRRRRALPGRGLRGAR